MLGKGTWLLFTRNDEREVVCFIFEKGAGSLRRVVELKDGLKNFNFFTPSFKKDSNTTF